jgi:uncharacterized protein YcnI
VSATLGSVALLLAAAGRADAHVTVHSVEAFQGATDAEIVFRVPDEEYKANTTKVEFDLPINTPIIGVAVSPPPGWTATTTETKLPKPVHTDDGDETTAVSKIVFSGGKITPGNYLDFPISADLLPSAPQLVFKAIQTYSDNNVVRWIEQGAPGGPEPEHPAPTLTLRAAGSDVMAMPDMPATAPAAPATPPSSAAAAPVAPTVGADSSTLQALNAKLADKADRKQTNAALAVAIAALVIGLLGGAAGAAAMRRRKS